MDQSIKSESFDVSDMGLVGMNAIDLHKEDVSRDAKSIRVDGSRFGIQTGSFNLDINVWLPKAAEIYGTSRDIRDYIIVPVPVNITELPNTNGDAFSLNEWLSFNPDQGRLAYQTFIGKPTFIEHCFPAETKITTKGGSKRISKLKVGDKVLTHKLRYKKVTRLFNNGVKWLSSIDCVGLAKPILATENHPFLVVDRRQLFVRMTNGGERQYTVLAKELTEEDINPHYRPVSDIYAGDYLVTPIHIGGNKKEDPYFAFLAGAWVAEGSYIKAKPSRNDAGALVGIALTLGSREKEFAEKIYECTQALGLNYNEHPNPTRGVRSILIHGREIAERFFELFGEYSHEKRLKKDARKWDSETYKYFLGGYISGDGSVKGGRLRCRTVSEKLASDLQNVFASLGIPATVGNDFDGSKKLYSEEYDKHYDRRPAYCIGASAQHAQILNDFTVAKHIEPSSTWSKPSTCIVVGRYLLTPVQSIQHKVKQETVYNIEVEKDHTYVAEGVIVHNCNKDVRQAQGIIFDSNLSKLKNFRGNHARLTLLLSFDRTRCPERCDRILSGELNTYSKGTTYRAYKCSICGQIVTPKNRNFCSHTAFNRPTYLDGRTGRLAYRDCKVLTGFECSSVDDPAFACAATYKEHLMRMA